MRKIKNNTYNWKNSWSIQKLINNAIKQFSFEPWNTLVPRKSSSQTFYKTKCIKIQALLICLFIRKYKIRNKWLCSIELYFIFQCNKNYKYNTWV